MLVSDGKWQESADIVVVGYGGAGAVAAISAHDLKAEVLIIEKQPPDHHYTNTQMSGGAFISPTEVKPVLTYMETLYRVQGDLNWTDQNTLHAWAEYIHQNQAWVESLGGKVKLSGSGGEHREIPGWECIKVFTFAGSGLGMHNFLTSQVAQRSIRVLFNATAQKLLTNLKGEVVGVRVTVGEQKLVKDIKANKAVIMTTGGFEYNETMKLNYLRVYPAYFCGTSANTGDGHRMAMEVGADLWHMNCCSARAVAKFSDFPNAFSMDFYGWNIDQRFLGRQTSDSLKVPAGYIIVDRNGKRFTSENFKDHALYYELALYDSQRRCYPRVPCFWIFDQRRMVGGPLPVRLGGASGPVQLYRWEKDNKQEVEKGWVIQGKSIEELARQLEIPPSNLLDTIRNYNNYCLQGNDPEFHRRTLDLVPIDQPPFYAVQLFPGGPNTQGGPKRDCRARVLNVDGDPIPRLYAAGELGSVYGMLYPSGGANLAECIAFGRIAGENAAKETTISLSL
jgi:succinate dehydrogenase/fumarate reductase flavoprotein subunit